MDDFLRSMRGEAGPRIARNAIKSWRNFWTVAFISWLALSVGGGYLLGPRAAHEHSWLLAVILAPLLIAPFVKAICETQIRNLNDLALAPTEFSRLDMAGVRRMWIAVATVVAGVGLFVAAALVQPADPFVGIWLAIAAVVTVGGFFVSPRILLGMHTRYGRRYDPDEDEWTFGFGKWWY